MSAAEDRINAGRAVVLRWLADEVKEAAADAKKTVTARLEPGERISAVLPDGTVIGSVTIGKPSETPTVTDERALLAWVEQHRPTEVVKQVNPAYLELLKQQVRRHGHAFDEATGAVIPGIELRQGSPSFHPQPDKAQVPLLRSRLAEVVANGLLELPSGDEKRAS